MIQYRAGHFGLCWKFFCCQGSVFPRALLFAVPSALIAWGFNHLLYHLLEFDEGQRTDASSFNLIWSGYTFVIGFLIVFRSTQAHHRYSEAASDMSRVRAVWLNAFSNLLSFCSHSEEKKAEVRKFQQLLAKLLSMLLFESVREAMEDDGSSLDMISLDGFDRASLEYLQSVGNKSAVVVQWLQQLIVQADRDKIITVAPPILSRVFQELSNGCAAMKQVQNLKDVPFPFAYAQLISVLLMVHTVLTPFLAGLVLNAISAAALSFFLMGGMWSLQIIACQIDHPVGNDVGDLPINDYLKQFNDQLLLLMDPRTLCVPLYSEQKEVKSMRSQGDFLGDCKSPASAAPLQLRERTETDSQYVRTDAGFQSTSGTRDVEVAVVDMALLSRPGAAVDTPGGAGGASTYQAQVPPRQAAPTATSGDTGVVSSGPPRQAAPTATSGDTDVVSSGGASGTRAQQGVNLARAEAGGTSTGPGKQERVRAPTSKEL